MVESEPLDFAHLNRLWQCSGLVFAVAVAVHWGSLRNGFVWDDQQFVVENHLLESPKHLWTLLTSNLVAGAGETSNLYRPVQSFTHFLDVRLWGLNPLGHHLTNVLLHGAASVAVFHMLAGLAPLGLAALLTVLFSAHPLQSEAVAYVSGRGDLLGMFFLGIGLVTASRRPGVALLAASLAAGSKESLALFPLFLIAYEHARGIPFSARRHLPFWGVTAAYIVLRLTVLDFQNTLNFYDRENVFTQNFLFRLYTYFTTVAKGLSLWFWPVGLHHERSWPIFAEFSMPRVWLSALLTGGLAGAAIRGWFRRASIGAGLAWFFLATFPTSNLVVIINAIFYDHWFLLPGLGLFLAAAGLLAGPWRNCRSMRQEGALLIVALAALSAREARRYDAVWRSPESLYTYILGYEPGSAKITNNLAMVYADQGAWERAIELYRRAISIGDDYAQTHHNLANACVNLGRRDEAIEELRTAVAMNPRFHQALILLGTLRLQKDEVPEAEECFTRAREACPLAAGAYLGLAEVHLRRRDPEGARMAIDEGLRALPDQPMLLEARERIASFR